MFNWFTHPSKKEQFKLLFSKYVPKELVNSVNSSGTSKLNELSEGSVEFIFVLVYGSTAIETCQMLDTVATIAVRNGWMVQAILCNLVVIVHGTLQSAVPALSRPVLANQLLVTLASQVKVLHGSELASFGSMGGTSRVTYGVLLPSFTAILTALNALPLGQAAEFLS